MNGILACVKEWSLSPFSFVLKRTYFQLLLLLVVMVFALTVANNAQASPTFQAAGVADSGNGLVKPAWPAHQIDDIALLFVETSGADAAVLSTPAGFVAVANSPQSVTSPGTGTRISVFWARATSTAMTAPAISPVQHTYARILTYRGVTNVGNPWDVTGGGTKAVASTSVTVSGVTTTLPDTLIVQAATRDDDSAALEFSAQTNVNLANITERSDGGTISGDGGGFAVWDGGKATAGATGNTTANITVSTVNAFLTIALKPSLIVAKSFSPSAITASGTSTLTVTLTNPDSRAITGAAFTDNYPANINNTAAPALTNSCGGTATAVANGSSLALSGGTIPANGSCSLTVQVTSTVAGTYLNSTGTVTTTNAGIGSAATATLAVSGAVPGRFNAYESSTVAGAITGVIMTKVAGTNFNLDLIALNLAKNAILTSFTGTVKVELLDSSGGGALDANACNAGWPVIQTLATNPVFVAGNNGRKTVSFTENNAWRSVRVRTSFPATGVATAIGCSTDNFAIRPASFASVSVTDADWQTAGTTNSLTNLNANTATPIHKAGQPFTLRATAVNGQATPATTTNYTGTPSAVLSACVGTACTATFGTFDMGTGTTLSGVFDSTTATYSEVGSFAMQLQDQAFASADTGDTGGDCTATGRYVCSADLNTGRFVPNHFDTVVQYDTVSNVFMPCPSGPTCPASGDLVYGDGFVYSGQPFTVQVTARNAAGAATLNYDSAMGLSKTATLSAWNTAGGATANPPGGNGGLTLNTIASTAFSAGVATTTNTPTYTFTTIPTAPTDIFMRAADADSVSSLRTIAATSVEGGVRVVSGRISIPNVYGSELLPLALTAKVQFFNATGSWVSSSSDNVTTIVAANFAFVFPVAALTACETALSVAGVSPSFTLNLSRPGAGNSGWTDLTLNLAAAATGNRCTAGGGMGAASTTANSPWLQFPVGTNPVGRATFGVYRGNNNIIYQRESY